MNDRFLKEVGVATEEGAMKDSIKSALRVRRGSKIYCRAEVGNERTAFRAELARLIRRESERYVHPADPISDIDHCECIRKIIEGLSARFKECVCDGRLRYGIAQKAFNLYLKYLWQLKMITEPPHCPVDRVVLTAAGIDGSWTRCDSEQQYMGWIGNLRAKSAPRHLAEWEDRIWLEWLSAQRQPHSRRCRG